MMLAGPGSQLSDQTSATPHTRAINCFTTLAARERAGKSRKQKNATLASSSRRRYPNCVRKNLQMK